MKELVPFKEDAQQFVDSSFRKEQFTFNAERVVNYKCYISNYVKAVQQKKGKVKQITFAFVAPKITVDAYELAWILTHSPIYNNIGGVKIIVELYTLEAFIEKLINIIPANKWFIKSSIPFNCVNGRDVDLLVKENRAIII